MSRRQPIERQLDKKWQHWLLGNLRRGCSTDELKQILAKEGFAEAAIRKAFDELPDLQALAATAAKASINVPNAKRFESPSIELYTAEDFLDASECAELVALVKAALRPSTISTPPAGEPDQLFRTSRTCDLIGNEGAVARLDAKIVRAMGIDPRFAETSQGQCYEVGQEFKLHTDFFKDYELDRYSTPMWGQRTWTFMIYLNEPEGGGETRFEGLDLTVKPKRGMALFWNNLTPSGAGNHFTRHQGMPVTAGTKVIITKWFRTGRPAKPLYTSVRISWTQGPKAA
jgi:prolyl 4-hydroxylase